MAEKQGSESQSTSPKKVGLSIIGTGTIALAAMASSFASVAFLGDAETNNTAALCAPTETASAAPQQPPKTDQVFVDLEEILITVGNAPADRYLKMKVSIVTNKSNPKNVREAEPILIDAFNTYLRSIELSDFENPDFYNHLREQLSRRAQIVLGASVSDGILITEFLLR